MALVIRLPQSPPWVTAKTLANKETDISDNDHTVFGIAQFLHEFVTYLAIMRDTEAMLSDN